MAEKKRTIRQIVAVGGGGFSEEPTNPLLDDFVLGLTGKRRPRVCFLPTGSRDAPGHIEKFNAAFPARRARAHHLTFFRPCGVRNVRRFLLDQDVIYVGGRPRTPAPSSRPVLDQDVIYVGGRPDQVHPDPGGTGGGYRG